MAKYSQQWQLADGTPDWEKFPDATHYCPETDDEFESFLKIEDNKVFFYSTRSEEWREDWVADPEDLDTYIFTKKA